jgi:hypothetical protein
MSNSERGRASTFALRVAVFCAPLLLGAALFEFAMYRTGDNWPVSKVIAAQSALAGAGGESLYGRANFSQQYNLSRSEIIKRRHPRILALGSSRVMQFRDFIFHPHEQEFYNGGGLIQNVNDLVAYTKQVREGRLPAPQVIIIGIDPWWVSEATDPPEKKSWLEGEEDAVYQFAFHVEAARYLLRTGKSSFPWKTVLAGKPRVSPFYNYPAFGIAAVSAGIGERFSDGSFLYTSDLVDFIRHPVYRDRLAMPVLDQVKRTYFLFAPTSKVERVRAGMLVQSLASLKAMGIEVYAYEPPFSTEVRQALDESKALETWWTEYKGWLCEQVESAGVPCLPIVRQEDYGLDDSYMFDGIHPGEVYDSYILETLVKRAAPGSLLASIDLHYLAALREKDNVMPLSFNPPPVARGDGGKISAKE